MLLLLPTLALSIPSLPGNIGTFEAAVVYTLSLYGIEDIFGFGFILHSISFIPYTLLGIPSNASSEEVKKAYRQMVMEYHPDKSAHLGEKQAQEAHLKFLEITEAYKELESKMGI